MSDIFGRGLAYGLGSDKPVGWWESARCKGMDPRLFEPLPSDTAGTVKALRVCAACPASVKAACLAEAMGTGDDVTIRGGTTPAQRIVMRRRQATAELNRSRRSFGAANAARAAKRGGMCAKRLHEMTPENTYSSGDGYVCCKPCRVDQQRAYRQRVAERGRQARELLAVGGVR